MIIILRDGVREKVWKVCLDYSSVWNSNCLIIFNNVSSFTSHKKTLKLWDWETVKLQNFSFFLSITFIYEPIFIQISMNANIKKTHILYWIKYDLKVHIRSNKAFYVYLFSSNKSSVKPTLPLMLPQIVCALISLIPTKREGGGSLFALWMFRRKLWLSMILKLGFMWPLFCYEKVARLRKMFQYFDQITTLNYVLMDNFCPCFIRHM